MLARELSPYKQEIGTKNAILSLVLEETTSVALLLRPVSSTAMLKATEKTTTEEEPEEVVVIGDDEEGETMNTSIYGVANQIEARHHIQHLAEVISNMKAQIDAGEIKDVVKAVLIEFQETIKRVMPQISEANITCILRSIRDLTCTALRPQTEDMDDLLEEMMP